MTPRELLEAIARADSGVDAMRVIHIFESGVIERCYLAARGTDKLKSVGNKQLYWKGRADAATDVRALKYSEDWTQNS